MKTMKELHAKMALMSKAEKLHLSLAEEGHGCIRTVVLRRRIDMLGILRNFHSVADRVRVLRLLGAFQGEDHLNIGEDYNLEHENSAIRQINRNYQEFLRLKRPLRGRGCCLIRRHSIKTNPKK